MRRFLLCLSLVVAVAGAQSLPQLPLDAPALSKASRLNMQFFHDEDKSSLVITDLVFPSPQRGIAAGILRKNDSAKGVLLTTTDAGKNWRQVELKDLPASVYFLDDTHGWFVGVKNLWATQEGGAEWRKIKKPANDMERVYFSSPERGWAFGKGKTVYLTTDAGKSWTKVPESVALSLSAENTTFSWMSFSSPQKGLLLGNTQRQPRQQLPTWMAPEAAMMRRQTPATLVTLETFDGGATWKSGVVSAFGTVTRAEFSGNTGIAIFRYSESFDWPSEVLRLEAGKSQSIFRRKDRVVTDGLILKNGSIVLVAIEPVGRMTSSPIPGRLHLIRSDDWKTWTEIPVDYRAAGRRAFLVAPDANNLWVATDEGMILKVVPQ